MKLKTKTTKHETQPVKLDFIPACEKFSKLKRGKNFFKDLATFLAEQTGVTYVLVGYPENSDMTRIKTSVLYAGGKFIDSYSYTLIGTPCENVIGRNCCYYPSNIQTMFPHDEELKTLSIESYIGLPLFSQNNHPVGLLALMDTKLIQNPKEIQEGLKHLVAPIAEELRKFYTPETVLN